MDKTEQLKKDEQYMRFALEQAKLAFEKDEVPIGAIIVCKDQVIARAHNLTEQLTDFTAHAEMQVFTMASEYLSSKYLDKCTLYVTLEPCAMCSGAAFWTRIGRIVYGASDIKRGFSQISGQILHPKTLVEPGILADDSKELLSEFFKSKR